MLQQHIQSESENFNNKKVTIENLFCCLEMQNLVLICCVDSSFEINDIVHLICGNYCAIESKLTKQFWF